MGPRTADDAVCAILFWARRCTSNGWVSRAWRVGGRSLLVVKTSYETNANQVGAPCRALFIVSARKVGYHPWAPHTSVYSWRWFLLPSIPLAKSNSDSAKESGVRSSEVRSESQFENLSEPRPNSTGSCCAAGTTVNNDHSWKKCVIDFGLLFSRLYDHSTFDAFSPNQTIYEE